MRVYERVPVEYDDVLKRAHCDRRDKECEIGRSTYGSPVLIGAHILRDPRKPSTPPGGLDLCERCLDTVFEFAQRRPLY